MSNEVTHAPGLTSGKCAALRLQVPAGAPEFIVGTHGLLWQWVGDGVSLIALTITSRRGSHLTAPENLLDSLRWQLDQRSAEMTGDLTRIEPDDARSMAGSTGRVVGSLRGQQYGATMTSTVMVASDGQDLYMVEVLARDSDVSRSLVAEILDSATLPR